MQGSWNENEGFFKSVTQEGDSRKTEETVMVLKSQRSGKRGRAIRHSAPGVGEPAGGRPLPAGVRSSTGTVVQLSFVKKVNGEIAEVFKLRKPNGYI